MQKYIFALFALFTLCFSALADIECPHVCSDNKCKLVKELTSNEFADLVLQNKEALNSYALNASVELNVRNYIWPNWPTGHQCFLDYKLKNTLLEMKLGEWYKEKRELYGYTTPDSWQECKDSAASYQNDSGVVTSYQYGTAEQLAEGYRTGRNGAKFYLYETASGERLVTLVEYLSNYFDPSDPTVEKTERTYSLSKSLYEGNYLYRYNTRDYNGFHSFCIYQ